MEHLLMFSKIYGIRQMLTYFLFYSFGKLIGEKVIYYNFFKPVEIILSVYFSNFFYHDKVDSRIWLTFEPNDVLEIDAFRKR